MRPQRLLPALVAVAPSVWLACGTADSSTEPNPTIEYISGNGQTGNVGGTLAQPLLVKVTSGSGGGVAGVAVTWAVTAGGGMLSATTTATDARGNASVSWTLGTVAGSRSNTAT